MSFKKQKMLIITLAIMMIFSFIGCGKKEQSVKDPSALFKAGTYITVVDGYVGKIKAEITFTDNEIAEIKILENSETNGIGSIAIEQLPADIVKYQSLGVDSISGATITSRQ